MITYVKGRYSSYLNPVQAQRNCELCVTVTGDSSDPLVGIYRFLEEDSSCVEFGCSYSKDGFSDNVYCFKPGPYKFEAGEQCPTETSDPGTTSTSDVPTGSTGTGTGSTGSTGSTVQWGARWDSVYKRLHSPRLSGV